MSSRIEAKVNHRYRVGAERVYDAWLDPRQVRLWMAAALQSFGLAGDIRRIEIDARVGGKFFFSDMRGETEACHRGEYLELDRPRSIVFTWIVNDSEESRANPSKVTLSIEPKASGCTATIVHEMDAKWIDYVSKTADGWGGMLAQIENLLGTTV